MSKPAITNFIQSFVAVVAGNVLYFLVMPYLPPAAQHTHKYDLGMLVDFWFCLVIFGAIKTASHWGNRRSREQRD